MRDCPQARRETWRQQLLAFSCMTSFWSYEHVDGQGFAYRGKAGFKSPRIADAAFRIINEAQQRRATALGAITLRIDPQLFSKVFGRKAVARLFDKHGEPIIIQQKSRARGPICVTRRPFLRPDIVKLDSQQRMQ